MLIRARAIARIVHEQAYDFDAKNGVWIRRVVSDELVGNIVTDAGRVKLHTYVYGTAGQRSAANLGSGFNFIGLSNNAQAPAAGDSSLAGELSADGLQRAQGVVVLPIGAGTLTTVSNQFTYTGEDNQGVQKTALFDASSGGNMAHEILFAQRTLGTNDTLTITFNITLT